MISMFYLSWLIDCVFVTHIFIYLKLIFRGRNPGFARKEAIKNNILKKESKKKIKKTLKNFYRFQIKETKINRKDLLLISYSLNIEI